MRRKIIRFSILILAVLALVACDLSGSGKEETPAGELETETTRGGVLASTIEADGIVQTNQSALLFWKTSGKVAEVLVQPGSQVRSGDLLASLDITALPPTLILAQAELISARKALADLQNSQIQRAQAQKAVDEAQEALEGARYPEALQAQALLWVAEAKKAVEEAQQKYEIILSPVPQSAIDQAYANLVLAENKVKETEDNLNRLENTVVDSGPPGFTIPPEVINSAKHMLRRAIKQVELLLTQEKLTYEKSLARYNALLTPPDPLEVNAAEAELAAAKAQLREAEKAWEEIKDGISPAEIAVLEAGLKEAQREWVQVKDGPALQDITLLETQIAAAEAAIRQTKITAPFDGTVTQVQSQVNDLVSFGALAFQLDDVSSLHVDLAVSEIDINRLQNGQEATITFDAVPGKRYLGEINDIALVGTEFLGVTNFMVRVALLNPDTAVKPGMTASVVIAVNESR